MDEARVGSVNVDPCCWLAATRVANDSVETETLTLHLGSFTGPVGSSAQRTDLSQPQKVIHQAGDHPATTDLHATPTPN